MIHYLIQSVSSGDFDEAGTIAGQLAKSHINMKFNLVNRNELERENITKLKLSTDIQQSSDSILRFVFNRIGSLTLYFDIQILSSNRMFIQRSYDHLN